MPYALAVIGCAFAFACFRVGMALTDIVRASNDNRHALDERRVAVEERRITLEEQAKRPAKRAEPMPQDLRNRIASFEDDWAREDEERTLMALYAEFDDWELVRKNLRSLNQITDAATLDAPFAEEFPR